MEVLTLDHPALALLPEYPTAEQIEALGHQIQSLESEHGVVDLRTTHIHADGLYGRGIHIPAGTVLVGLPHKAGHLNVCVGDVVVWTPAGRVRHRGAHILSAGTGVLRVGFAISDTTWFSIHQNTTGTTDLETIEAALVEHPERLMTRRHPPAGAILDLERKEAWPSDGQRRLGSPSVPA